MGGSSKSSSSATSSEVADSYNQISTLTQSGSGPSAGLSVGGTLNGSPQITSDSNNATDSYNSSVNYGASGSSSAGSGDTAGTTSSGIDWSEVIVWVVGGLALTFVLKSFGDKNV